jgi:hypothetical protein
MAEFTKDIQTLTQQAGTSPQLQTNTGSLATDVISAANFGLGLYRQNKAATALVGAKKQQVEYQTRLDEATLSYGNFQASMLSQEQNGVSARAKRTKFLNNLGDASFQTSVISASNKLTGTTFTETESNLNKAEVRRQEDAANLTVSARESAISAGLSAVGIENLTAVQQQELVVQGSIANKKREVQAAELSNLIQTGTYQKMTSAKKTAAYLSPVMADFSLNLASKLNTGVEELGGFGSLDKEPLFSLLASERTSIDAQVRQHVSLAESLGITLSLEDQNAFRTASTSILDNFEKLMGQEAVTKALGSIPDRLLSQNLVKGLTSGAVAERDAALIVSLKLAGNELSGVDIAESYKTLAGISTGAKLPEGGDDLKDSGRLINDAFTAPANDDGTFTPEQLKFNMNLVENSMQGTPTQTKKAVKGNVYKNLISSISEFKGKNFAVTDHAAIEDVIVDLGSRVIASASAAAYNAPKQRLVGGTSRDRQFVNTDTAKNFTLDPKTVELIPNEGFIYISDEVKNYNNYIRSSIKALEFVGGDVEAFKRDVANSVLVVR